MWFLLFYLITAKADPKYSYPPQKFAAQGIERIHVEGLRGSLTLIGRPGRFFRAQVKHSKNRNSDDWHLVIERRQDRLHIEVFNVLYGSQWKRHVKQELWPEFDIQIEGPSRSAQVSWREGRMEIRRWQSPVEASLLKGQVLIENGSTELGLQAVEADVSLKNFAGQVRLQGERGSIEATDGRGTLQLNWLSGPIRLQNVSGQVKVESQEGALRATGGDGNWELKVAKGSVQLENFKGQLKALGETSSWDISAHSPADVEVITQGGAVNVRWLKGDTKLFLSTREGAIQIPSAFRIEDRDGVQVVEGRKGKNPKGHLFVRTTSGVISFR